VSEHARAQPPLSVGGEHSLRGKTACKHNTNLKLRAAFGKMYQAIVSESLCRQAQHRALGEADLHNFQLKKMLEGREKPFNNRDMLVQMACSLVCFG
jgi:hypothetical protein